MTDDGPLLAALATIRERGAIGEASLTAAVANAERFVLAVPSGARHVVDLGSGGGLPALVIAVRRPDVAVTMVERRATRADLLRRAVSGLGVDGHCVVLTADVATVASGSPGSFDVVTARSFGPADIVARWAGELLCDGGVALVSEPPDARPERWAPAVLARHGLADQGCDQGIRRLVRLARFT